MDESPRVMRARLRADECRRRVLELTSGERITVADVEFAAQRAEEARSFADQAQASAARATAWVVELWEYWHARGVTDIMPRGVEGPPKL